MHYFNRKREQFSTILSNILFIYYCLFESPVATKEPELKVVSHNRVQVLNIPVLLLTCSLDRSQVIPVDSIKDIVRSSVKVPEFDKHLKKARGYIGRNIVEITIKMKTIVWKPLIIKISIKVLKFMYYQLLLSLLSLCRVSSSYGNYSLLIPSIYH